MGRIDLPVPVIGRSIALALVLLCGACGQKGVGHPHHDGSRSHGGDAAPAEGNAGAPSGDEGAAATLYVTTDGLEVADARGVTVRVPFGTAADAVTAAVKPAVGVAEKVFSVPCGGRKVTEYDFASVTLSFENGGLVSWRAFGTVRMPSGIGEGTPREDLAAAYPDVHSTTKRPTLDMAEAFAAGPIRGYLRENLITSIDGGKPLCIE